MAEPNFSAPPEAVKFNGLLFDMDGTIIDSTEAIIKHWHSIGKELGVDPKVILATSHGRRSIDVLKLYDPSKANWDYVRAAEGILPQKYGGDALEIPGSRALLDTLDAKSVPWIIVTSGTRPLVTGWLDVMQLAHPENMVTAEDVENGKPDPACYKLGRQRLNLPHKGEAEGSMFIVFEDAPAGVRSGKAAGFRVVGLATTHSVEQLQEAGADWIVRDMRSVTLKGWDVGSGVGELVIKDALVGTS